MAPRHVAWLPLRFHTALGGARIHAALHDFNSSSTSAFLYEIAWGLPAPSIRIAWRKPGFSHQRVVGRG